MASKPAVLFLALAAVMHATAVLRVLPLGDSITFGCGDYCYGETSPTFLGCSNSSYGVGDACCAEPFGTPVEHPWTPCFGCSSGYRAPLEALLKQHSGVNAWEFVGSVRQDGGSVHEGHPGWRIDQIAGTCYNGTRSFPADGTTELAFFGNVARDGEMAPVGDCQGGNASFFQAWTALEPDVIILMIGTNDIGQLFNVTCNRSNTPWVCPVDSIVARLDGLLTATFAKLPETHVFLSDLVGIGPSPCYGPDGPTSGQGLGETMVLAYNAALPSLTAQHVARGHRVTHVPLQSETGIGDDGKDLCPCEYHPTHDGYTLMANAYFSAITGALVV